MSLDALTGAWHGRTKCSLRPECLHPQAEFIFPSHISGSWFLAMWFLPWGKVGCQSASMLGRRCVCSVLCPHYGDTRGGGAVRGLHPVELGSRTSYLGVARIFSSPYHTAVGILRPKGPQCGVAPVEWGRQSFVLPRRYGECSGGHLI